MRPLTSAQQLGLSLEVLMNVEYLLSQTEPLTDTQARYLEVLRSENHKLKALWHRMIPASQFQTSAIEWSSTN